MLNLGTLNVKIQAEGVDKTKSDLNSLKSSFSQIGKHIQSGVEKAMKAAAAAATVATAAIIKFGKDSIQAGMQFDSAMSQVAATMGTTTSEISQLRNFALEMGRTTQFTATEAAEALNYMALAGYDVEKSMGMLPNVMNLAAAGGMDLARASDMVTDASSALGMSIEETTSLVDMMAKAASTGNTSVQQLGDAILKIGATGLLFKKNQYQMADGTDVAVEGIQQEIAALTVLADNGIKASEAGTHLRNMLLALSSPRSKGAAAYMEDFGISLYDAEGRTKEFSQVIGDLQKAMSGLTDEERTKALSTIFNKTDLASINALLGTNKDRWDEIYQAILNADGAAEQMAKTQMDNLKGDITYFKSAWEGLQIAVSDFIQQSVPIRKFVQEITDKVSHMGDVVAAINAIMSGDEKLLESMDPEIVAEAEHYLQVLGDIKQRAQEIKDKITEMWNSFKKGFSEGWDTEKVEEAFGHLVQTAQDLGKAIEDAWKKNTSGTDDANEQLESFGQQLGQWLSTYSSMVGEIFALIGKLAQPVIDYLGSAFKPLMDGMGGYADALSDFYGAINDLIQAAEGTVLGAWLKDIAEGFGLINGSLASFPIKMLTQVINLLTDFTKIATGIIEGKSLSEIFEEEFSKTGEAISDFAEQFGDWLIEGVGPKLSQFVDTCKSDWDRFTTDMTNVGQAVAEWAGPVIESIQQIPDKIGEFFTQTIPEHFNTFLDNLSKIPEGVAEQVTTIYETFTAWCQGFIEPITSGIDTVKGLWDEFLSWLGLRPQEQVPIITSAGQAMSQGLADGIQSGKSTIESVVNGILEFLESAASKAESLWNRIKSAVTGASSAASTPGLGIGNGNIGNPFGTHRTGLYEVPYDGYIAQLHKGERVLTAAQSNKYNKERTVYDEGKGITNITVNNYSPQALDERETARLYRQTQRELAYGF